MWELQPVLARGARVRAPRRSDELRRMSAARVVRGVVDERSRRDLIANTVPSPAGSAGGRRQTPLSRLPSELEHGDAGGR